VDVRKLPITPMEAFVLSRVDGKATGSEIALATGMSIANVVAILQKLDDLGAVQYGDAKKAASEGTKPTSPASTPGNPGPATVVGAVAPPDGRLAATPISSPRAAAVRISYDPNELDAPADLDQERKHRILEAFARLSTVSHYELLGVPREADKKAIKNAYYDVVGLFHPDKYFGKSLGAFKPKLEKIFQRVTEAHDTLTRAASRAEYDSYLASQEATQAFEQSAPSSVAEIQREIEREARRDPAFDGSSRPTPPASPSLAPMVWSMPPGGSDPRPSLTADERKRALARKLRVSMPPASARSVPASPVPSSAVNVKEVAADALRRRYETRLAEARDDQVRRYTKQADDAVAAGNHVAAANALRIAVSLVPDDVPLKDQLGKVERQASAFLADQYLEQARYDERRGHLAEAAHTYEKVLRGRPSAHVYERAAYCLVESGGDLKKASEFAKKAVELAPNETAYRITLARIFAKAGMEASAASELERARTLDPRDDTVKDWLKRLKRGEI
jgi:curved DNA-binding protein CbpA